MAARISGFGWRVSSARRSDNMHARFLASNALIAIVDIRKAEVEGLTAILNLSETTRDSGIAILALADQHEQPRIAEKCYEAGATHFLDMFNVDADLRQAINFAYRYAEQMRGGNEGVKQFRALLEESDLKWSFNSSSVQKAELSDSLRHALPSVDFSKYPITGIYRELDDEARIRVRGAMGRIKDGSPQAAVPHELDGKKVIHHLHVADDWFHGRLEFVDEHNHSTNWTERDLLSGLRNASAARSWIDAKIEDQKSLGLALIGLKNFPTINAAYGRGMGDQVLRVVGQRLLTETTDLPHDNQIVSRIDGQNFLFVIDWDQSETEFTEFVMTLLDAVGQSVTIDQRTIQLLPRVGLTAGDQDGDAASAIRRSSLALAEAMASDSVRIKVSQKSSKMVRLEHRLESELQDAINCSDIAIALQPQIRIETGQLIGAEALARWNHPEYGLLGAATLFAVADRAGLMELLSAHIHKRALEIAAKWPSSLSFLRLSINVTAGDLADHRFVARLEEEIEKSGFDADRLTLEITESELISDMKGSVARLTQLRNSGLKIAIDDFGTGYSSLAYLKNLPLDYLKIDSGLTSDISGSEKDQVVVRSIIDMAKSLGLAVIAEGVETEAQLETLTLQGCEYFQGFLRSGPLTPEDFEIFGLRSD
ncbi:MAG: hypothetical protein Pars2KO_29690 [Parasphingorhabdus sp.]